LVLESMLQVFIMKKDGLIQAPLHSIKTASLIRKKPVAYQETLSVNEIYLETVMLGFRQFNVGVAADFFPIHTQNTLHEMQEKGWLILKNTRYCLTESGCIWLDAIIKQLT